LVIEIERLPKLLPPAVLFQLPQRRAQIEITKSQHFYLESCFGWIVVVFAEVISQVPFSAADPIRAIKGQPPAAPVDNFGHRRVIDINGYHQFRSVRIANDEGMFGCSSRNRFIDVAESDDVETRSP
jgi:hypothetical protein